MASEQEIMVTLSVLCKTPEEAVKASEVLSRAGVGLALESLSVSINLIDTTEDEEEEVERP